MLLVILRWLLRIVGRAVREPLVPSTLGKGSRAGKIKVIQVGQCSWTWAWGVCGTDTVESVRQ